MFRQSRLLRSHDEDKTSISYDADIESIYALSDSESDDSRSVCDCEYAETLDQLLEQEFVRATGRTFPRESEMDRLQDIDIPLYGNPLLALLSKAAEYATEDTTYASDDHAFSSENVLYESFVDVRPLLVIYSNSY